MILEGARQLDVARSTLQGAEQKETRIKKELKKAAKKATAEEIREMSGRYLDNLYSAFEEVMREKNTFFLICLTVTF